MMDLSSSTNPATNNNVASGSNSSNNNQSITPTTTDTTISNNNEHEVEGTTTMNIRTTTATTTTTNTTDVTTAAVTSNTGSTDVAAGSAGLSTGLGTNMTTTRASKASTFGEDNFTTSSIGNTQDNNNNINIDNDTNFSIESIGMEQMQLWVQRKIDNYIPQPIQKVFQSLSLEHYSIIGIVFVAIVIQYRNNPTIYVLRTLVVYWFIQPLYHLFLRIIGVALGIGFGLGLAAHVYDQLHDWKLAMEYKNNMDHGNDGYETIHTGYDEFRKSNRYQPLVNDRDTSSNGRFLYNRSSSFGGNSFRMNRTGGGGTGQSIRASSVSAVTATTAVATATNNNALTTYYEENDEQTYASLMKSAGYTFLFYSNTAAATTTTTTTTTTSNNTSPTNKRLLGFNNGTTQPRLRGQVIRTDNLNFQNRIYNFTESRISDDEDETENNDDTGGEDIILTNAKRLVPKPVSKAVVLMNQMWPTLPVRINQELGRAIEYIVRDFIAIWYGKVDYGCIYQDPEVILQQKKDRKNNKQSQQQSSSSNTPYYNKRMLYSMCQYRPIPFLDNLYESMTIIFGNLATRVENVNLFELVLLKWVQVLSHTFKVYRALRKNVLKLQQSTTITPGNGTNVGSSSTRNININRQSLYQQQQQQQTATDLHQQQQQGGNDTIIDSSMRSSFSRAIAATTSKDTTTTTTTQPASLTAAASQRVKNFRTSLGNIGLKRSSNATVVAADASTVTTTSASNASEGNNRDLTTIDQGDANNTRKQQMQQQQQVPSKYTPVSEMAMTKEFLFAGKLHKAVTFGLDVKALLFSDSTGRDCGVPPPLHPDDDDDEMDNADGGSSNRVNKVVTEDEVLERRLFGTKLLSECEIDYNRVLGHRIVRTLVPRTDYSCGIVRSLLTEIMGGCVLTPIMGLFSPDYINSWIIAGLVSTPTPEDVSTTGTEVGNKAVNQDEKQSVATTATTTETVAPPVSTGVTSPTSATGPLGGVVIEECGEDGNDNIEVQAPHKFQEENDNPTNFNDSLLLQRSTHDASTPDLISGESIHTTETATQLDTDERSHDDDNVKTTDSLNSSIDLMYTQLALSLIDLQRFVDFDDFRNARMSNTPYKINWDDPECRAAVIRLVLVIEAALSHGRCIYKSQELIIPASGHTREVLFEADEDVNSFEGDVPVSMNEDEDDHENDGAPESHNPSVDMTILDYESVQLSQILMELTSDMDAFEEKIEALNSSEDEKQKYETKYMSMIPDVYVPSAQEQSTVRTLIAAWMHSGQVYRAVSLVMKAQSTILAPFYLQNAFLRTPDNSNGFVRQLIALVDVAILVDTMAVLGVPRLENADQDTFTAIMTKPSIVPLGSPNPTSNGLGDPIRTGEQARSPSNMNNTMVATSQFMSNSSTAVPRYLDFNRNESFAASLRSERERRLGSWERLMNHEIYGTEGYNEPLPIICHSGNRGTLYEDEHTALHKELHHIARIFYTGTNMIAIRDAARRKTNPTLSSSNLHEGLGDASVESSMVEDLQQVSLITIETACPRRRLEVPDDDSSFLLRAQPRPLNAVGVHRDQRNHDQSYKCFAATYDEPALPAAPGHYTGGRYIRKCLVRYFPIDRTACVSLPTEAARKLDQRKSRSSIPDVITVGQSLISSGRPAPFLSAEFLRDRHLCQRWVPKGTTRTQSILASNVMEPTDFTSIPRSGKAIDFVYRMNFYERPMLDLAGKHFTVHDSAALGPHRADASALELSDASISVALLLIGSDGKTQSDTMPRPVIEMGKDGYPVVWMKFSRKQDDAHVEVKPYRTSFVRAALMITAARQEAQLQCLVKCVKDGSAKQASKALTDAALKPTILLLEYANSRSREKQSLLQRDLKLGVNHIDQGQLRRNGLLLPRYPTSILEFSASVEDVVQSTDVKGVNNIFGSGSTIFKIRCITKVALIATDEELEGDEGYLSDTGAIGKIFQEQWIIYRTMKEFQALHKHLKAEVSVAESSGTAGSRLVGAATAAFAVTNALPGRQRQKKLLIPSLSQASKAGALGVTRKLNAKRKEILEAYLGYLLSPGHLIGQCHELLLFLGAFYPFPSHARVGVTVPGDSDPLGRTEMLRTIIETRSVEIQPEQFAPSAIAMATPARGATRTVSTSSVVSAESTQSDEEMEEADELEEKAGSSDMMPSIKSKIDKVHLAQVRNRVFELLRYQFGFENASFIRNRMLQALKTVSFAVTSPPEFRKMLYKAHLDYVNADALAGWIKTLSDLLWPEGVFFTSSPPLSPEELRKQATQAKEALHSSFPAEVRAILGQDLTRDGMDILFEMLQNRLVLKSMAYMLFDLLWLEVFPEIGDILTGGIALDIDPKIPN